MTGQSETAAKIKNEKVTRLTFGENKNLMPAMNSPHSEHDNRFENPKNDFFFSPTWIESRPQRMKVGKNGNCK